MKTALIARRGPAAAPSVVTAAGTAEAEVTVEPSGRWEGVLGVMNQWSADKRMLRAPEGPVRTRPLPLPLLVQPELAPGHDGSRLGIAHIERIWSDGDRVMGSGSIDMEDPLGRELARKIRKKFIRFVSLDVDDSTELQVCLDEEDGIVQDCDPARGEAAGYGQVFSGWRVMGATLLAHPAFPDAYITLAEEGHDLLPAERDDDGDDGEREEAEEEACVCPDDGGWEPCECDNEDAVPANAERTGPAKSRRAMAREDAPVAQRPGCVKQVTRDGVTQWWPAACDEEGAVPANPNRTGPDPSAMNSFQAEGAQVCVVPDEESETGWRQAPCDADGAVPANAEGTGPAEQAPEGAGRVPLPTGADVPQVDGDVAAPGADEPENAPEPDEPEVVPDMGGGCVVPDEESETGWRQAPCDADGAVPANAEGTGPAEQVTDATTNGERETMAAAFAVDTSLPWAARETAWDGAEARRRVADWATSGGRLDPAKMGRAFLVVEGPADNIGSYRFGVADVISGELRLVWKGVVAALAALNGARSATTIPAEKKNAALGEVKTLYRKAAEEFDDDSIAEAAQELGGREPGSFQEGDEAPSEEPVAESAREEAPQEPRSYVTGTAEDMGFGCVKQDEDGRWVSVACDEEGAHTAGPDGQPMTEAGGFACVVQDQETGRWVSASCDAEGARLAGPDGQPLSREEEEQARQKALAASCLPCGEAEEAEALVASAGQAPGFTPLGEWFENPNLSGPTPITVDAETGQIRGHLAVWGTCHVGYSDRCITPPKSRTDYAYFHTAAVATTTGQAEVGVLTMDTGHAGLNLNASNATAHYDNTGTQCAVVRVGEDAHGIWMAGACLPFISGDERLRLSLARFSGDWRAVRGNPELVAALAVNSPGFPVPQRRRGQDRQEYALVAAGLLPAARPERPAGGGEQPVDAFTAEDVEAAIQRAVQDAFEQQAISQRKAVLAQEQREARRAAERAEFEERFHAVTGRLAELREAERERRVQRAMGTLQRVRVQALARRVDTALAGRDTGVETAALPPVLGLPKPTRGDLDFARGFKNWVSEQGGLPRKIKSVAKHLKRKGMSDSRAIATAVNVAKKACRSADTNWPGVQKINSKSQAEFCAAVRRWEEMKAAAKAS